MQTQIGYIVRMGGEPLTRGNGEKVIYWEWREAVTRARTLIRHMGIKEEITVHQWLREKPLMTIKRNADGSVHERGAFDSVEFNQYLKSELLGCATYETGGYQSIGYVLSTRGDKVFLAQGDWKPWNEGGAEKLYLTLSFALKRARRELTEHKKEFIIINRRFTSRWGSQTDRQVAMLRRELTGHVVIEWSINGAFPGAGFARTGVQIRELGNEGGSWADFIGPARPFTDCEGQEIYL